MNSAHKRVLIAAGAAVLGLTLSTSPVLADSGHDRDSTSQQTAQRADNDECTDREEQRLRGAKDNFRFACLPGQGLGGPGQHDPDVTSEMGEGTANLPLIAHADKPAAFDGAFNSDLAFKGNYAFAGNYNGFAVWDISNPANPQTVAEVVCPGSQNDISVSGDLLVLSTDSSRSDDSCSSVSQSATQKSSWEGLKVFDISDPTSPAYVAAVETDCGSHTHTLAPSGNNLWVYVSSYFPNASFPDCQPPHDKISVVKIPKDRPAEARVISTPVLFSDGGNPSGNYSRETSGCHDLTAYPSKNVMAGACMGDGLLLDISDRAAPQVTESVRDTTNFAFWHSATFNNAGTKVVFTDELGGGGGATCNPTVGPNRGANGIYDIEAGQLVFKSYYKIPRTNSDSENCVAHNGSLIPVAGKDIMVQAWYQGGVSVFDFTDSANPKEIAWFDRGPIHKKNLILGGPWSTYYYNGYIYSNEIHRGFDVFQLTDPAQNGTPMSEFNPQSQPSFNG